MFGSGNKGWVSVCNVAHADGNCDCLLQPKRPKVEESLDELSFQRSACAAAQYGQLAKLQSILSKHPEAVHTDGVQGGSGYSSLHYAARAGHTECVQLLISAGANVDSCTRSGHATPLMRAAHQGHLKVVQQLVAAKADGAMQDADGETALHKAASQGHEEVFRFLASAYPHSLQLRDKHGRTASERIRSGAS